MKRLQELDHYIFGRQKFWIYPLGVFFILLTGKYDINKVIDLAYNIFFITIFFLVFFILPRKFFMKYILKLNLFLFNYFPFILKVRMMLIDVSYWIHFFLSYMMYLDKFLIKILLLHRRVNYEHFFSGFFLFVRKLVYYNFWIFFTMPFYLIMELYEGFKEFIELKISIKDYLMWRTHFLFLSILFVMLFDVKRISIIILLWVLDIIIMVYYYWIINWIDIKGDHKRDWKTKGLMLRLAFNNVWMDYNSIANKAMLNKRFDYVLLFKGLEHDKLVTLDFYFIRNIKVKHTQFWNMKYIGYQKAKLIIEDYYDSDTDLHFILKMLYKIAKKYQSNNNFNKKLLELGPDEFIKNSFTIYYIVLYQKDHLHVYNLVLDAVKRIYNRDDLISFFYKLLLKYKFFMWVDYLRYEEVKDFLNELYKERNH